MLLLLLPLWFLLSLLIAVLLLQLLLSLQDMLVVFFFFKHQADVSSTGIDLHASVQTLLLLLSLLLLLPLWFLLSFLIVVLLLQLLSANTVVNQFEHPRRFFLSHLFSLFSLLLDPGKCDLCCSPLASGRRSHILAGTVHWW